MNDLICREALLQALDQYAVVSFWLDEEWYKEIVSLIKQIDSVAS